MTRLCQVEIERACGIQIAIDPRAAGLVPEKGLRDSNVAANGSRADAVHPRPILPLVVTDAFARVGPRAMRIG